MFIHKISMRKLQEFIKNLAEEKNFTWINRRLRQFMMKENCNIRWRFVGGKNSLRVVNAIGVRQRIDIGEIREIERTNDCIEILRLGQG